MGKGSGVDYAATPQSASPRIISHKSAGNLLKSNMRAGLLGNLVDEGRKDTKGGAVI